MSPFQDQLIARAKLIRKHELEARKYKLEAEAFREKISELEDRLMSIYEAIHASFPPGCMTDEVPKFLLSVSIRYRELESIAAFAGKHLKPQLRRHLKKYTHIFESKETEMGQRCPST